MVSMTQPVKKGLEMPNKSQVIGTTPPASTVVPKANAKAAAHGRIPDSGSVMVEGDADTYTIYIYSIESGRWRFPGSDSGSYQKEFTEAHGHLDFFEGPTGALFQIVATGGAQTILHNGDDV